MTASLVQDAAFAKVLTLNVQRVFTLTQKCLPLLRAAAEQGGKWDDIVYKDPARIINVSCLLHSVEGGFSERIDVDRFHRRFECTQT